jgi:uncharacterized repeat protein (TIGR03803 family)
MRVERTWHRAVGRFAPGVKESSIRADSTGPATPCGRPTGIAGVVDRYYGAELGRARQGDCIMAGKERAVAVGGVLARSRGWIILAVLIAACAAPGSRAEAYTFKILHSFCAKADCADGEAPHAALVMDTSGRLYGTTYYGGAHCKESGTPTGCGTVFDLVFADSRWTETALYSFCAKVTSGGYCADGAYPNTAGLVVDGSEHLYGTTPSGGTDNYGVVFELTPNSTTEPTKWTESVPHDFCGVNSCASEPYAGLIEDKAGHFYGTTYQGGAHDAGTVFALSYDSTTKKWVETTLYSFCNKLNSNNYCIDGATPEASLVMDGSGNLYGTTYGGGAANYGTAFMLTPNNAANPTKWTERVVHSFCVGENCPDGYFITTALVIDKSGNLYGSSYLGGARSNCHYSCGLVFELTPFDVAKTKWTEAPVYTFCARAEEDCADGMSPSGNLTINPATGTLYGTTVGGGANCVSSGGCGTIFQLAYDATAKKWTETVLHSFCADLSGDNCSDGNYPQAGVIIDKSGNLYGTTAVGGAQCATSGGCGTAFELEK